MPARGVRDDKKWAHWRGVIGEQRRSGMGIAAYCRKKGVSAPALYWWARRQGKEAEAATGPAGFVELVAGETEAAGSGVELRVGERVSIRLSRGFDPGTLRRVLDVIDSAGS